MSSQILTIAYYTLLEALRNRLSWAIIFIAIVGLGLSGFLNELAITESAEIQIALLASFLRFAAVFLLATFVLTSMIREFNDKVLELLMASSLPRAAYFLGKFAGFAVLAVIPSLLFGALIAVLASPLQSLLWTITLVCELWLIAAFSLLCVFTFNQVILALGAVMAFYLMARSVVTLQLIGQHPLGAQLSSQQVINRMIDLLSALLPHLDSYTRTDWLVYGSGSWSVLPALLMQTLVYLGLLLGAALFDLYRKNF